MKVVDNISLSLATEINKRVGKTSVNVLRYALNDLFNYMIFYLGVVFVGFLSGRIIDSLLAPVAFSVLRRYSGGLHLSTDKRCTIVSALMVMVSIYTPMHYWYNGAIANSFALLIVVLFAPSGTKAPTELHRKFKIISVILVGANFIIGSSLLCKVFFVQAITTIPAMQAIVNKHKL